MQLLTNQYFYQKTSIFIFLNDTRPFEQIEIKFHQNFVNRRDEEASHFSRNHLQPDDDDDDVFVCAANFFAI